ncbi:MAG TPA: transglycosylase domain-containing protein [Thermoleophilaceae bacterium]|jgi:penicillin-binding protein 1A
MQEPPTPTLLRTPTEGDEPIVQPDGSTPSPPRRRPKLKKLRLALILVGLGALALVSTVFGMLMAVASDLPALENRAEYRNARNSTLLSANMKPIATLTGNNNRILLGQADISPNIKNALIAIEDKRFYQHKGVDYKGIARAMWQDLLRQKAAQGGSTITQQFVKNALSAQGHRSVFQKMREAALAYHLERKWSKSKILTEYLNTVYFGNGAYGVESAMRTYYGSTVLPSTTPAGLPQDESQPRNQKQILSRDATPAEAALLAGMIASPSLYDPADNPRTATKRRNEVLKDMLDQGSLTHQDYLDAVATAVPSKNQITPPRPDSDQPYFSSWLTQQLVDRYRPGLVFGGGLKVRTTIDPELQQAAEQAISSNLTGVGPDASLVAIENKTGKIRAMVGGSNFNERPFNLATEGHRQPGSSFKPFTLVAALERGYGPASTFTSQPKIFPVPHSRGKEKFVVHNFENSYSGIASLSSATAHSDNSVFAELGLRIGTRKIAHLGEKMGLRTPISTNPAMTLGGLKEGVTPLEMAYAYSTIANKGVKVTGSLAPDGQGPVAIESVNGSGIDDHDQKRSERVFPESVGETAQEMLAGVIQGGTGTHAQIGEFAAGKTGTTENYGDAWFVGFNKELTVAVWVGYADKLKPMKTEYRGGPVEGGTYPADIWHDFMTSWINIRDTRDAEKGKDHPDHSIGPPTPYAPAPSAPSTGQAGEQGGGDETPKKQAAPKRQSPSSRPHNPAPAPAPAPTPAPGGGGGTGGGGVGAPTP